MPTRVLGLGIDVVEVERIARAHRRHGDRFLLRFCREGEWQERSGEALFQHLSGLFAAKEAILKALGTGWSRGLSLRQVEILSTPRTPPSARLHGAALERAESLGVERLHLSVTHERSYAAAVAILEGRQGGSERPDQRPGE